MSRDFNYCNGKGCALKNHCVRYVEGRNIPNDAEGYWWIENCNESNRDMFLSTK